MLKNKNGITLVALVVTIVVLLILAGISISIVLGDNGIVKKAQDARNKTAEASKSDIAGMGRLDQDAEDALVESNLANPIEGVKIPVGFMYVGGTKGSGIVISDNQNDKDKYKNQKNVGTDLEGNQYVWIPCTTDESSSAVLYERTEWGVESDNGTSAIKDELTLTDSTVTYLPEDILNGITGDISKEIVAQINAEKESVKKYGGYYIGRYEVGINGEEAVVKYNQTSYANIKWSAAYSLAKKLVTNLEATSYLCSSYAWDTAVNFIQNNSTAKNYATSIEGLNGNWTSQAVKDEKGKIIKPADASQKLNTGLTTAFCNVFDMGGNEGEFTTEINPGGVETLIIRGGLCYNNAPAGYRWDGSVESASTYYGFRTTLFLK